jgi:hypothetical protein
LLGALYGSKYLKWPCRDPKHPSVLNLVSNNLSQEKKKHANKKRKEKKKKKKRKAHYLLLV